MTSEDDLLFDEEHIWHPYTSLTKPLKCYYVSSCKGTKIKLADGKELIDGMSSWWCTIHGYNNTELNEAAKSQLRKVTHVMFGGLTDTPAIELSKKLVSMTDNKLEYCFFVDSGSIAVEVALKMAIQYCKQSDQKSKTRFLTISYGYHGDTFGAMSVCDPINSMHSMYKGILHDNIFVDSPNIGFFDTWDESSVLPFKKAIETHDKEIAAVILEPIVQGAGGMRFYHPNFLRRVREYCDRFKVLLILDEIATGFGRTGKLFAYQHANIVPDIICLGKALTGGYMTMGCTMCSRKVAQGVCAGNAKFMHGPFMGNPLGCAIANKSLEIIQRGKWKTQVPRIEEIMNKELVKVRHLSVVHDVRVLGAIGVVELNTPVNTEWFQKEFVKRGVWIRPFNKLVYIMPQFIITETDLKTVCQALVDVVTKFAEEKSYRITL